MLKHRDHGKSSESYINTKEILGFLDVKKGDTFLDAGCGNGHVAISASKILGDDSTIYAVDIHEPLINTLKDKNIKNIHPILSDLGSKINIKDSIIDTILMVNVFHGFKANETINQAISEFKRILKVDGKIAIIDFKKNISKNGPPIDIRLTPEELETYFKKHGFKMTYLNNKIGIEINKEYTHYLIVFNKD